MYIKSCIVSTIDSLNYSINGIIKSRQNIFIIIATFAPHPSHAAIDQIYIYT